MLTFLLNCRADSVAVATPTLEAAQAACEALCPTDGGGIDEERHVVDCFCVDGSSRVITFAEVQ